MWTMCIDGRRKFNIRKTIPRHVCFSSQAAANEKSMSALTHGTDVEKVRSWIMMIYEGETATPSGDT